MQQCRPWEVGRCHRSRVATAAVGPVELRFYHLRNKGIKADIKPMGVLELRGSMPPPPPQVGGVYVALFQGRQLQDLACLSSLEGQPVAEAEQLAEDGETRGAVRMSIEEEASQEEGDGEDEDEEESKEEEEVEEKSKEEEEESQEDGLRSPVFNPF